LIDPDSEAAAGDAVQHVGMNTFTVCGYEKCANAIKGTFSLQFQAKWQFCALDVHVEDIEVVDRV